MHLASTAKRDVTIRFIIIIMAIAPTEILILLATEMAIMVTAKVVMDTVADMDTEIVFATALQDIAPFTTAEWDLAVWL